MAKKNSKRIQSAIALARMYGVKETLSPLPNISNEQLIPQVLSWTDEYLESEEEDIVDFFERKKKSNTKKK